MEKLTLEQIEEVVLTYDFMRNCSMSWTGLCVPEAAKIFYNPVDIPSEREFYLTLLHEMVHATDSHDSLSEDDVEMVAVRSYEDENIAAYVREIFPYSLCRAGNDRVF